MTTTGFPTSVRRRFADGREIEIPINSQGQKVAPPVIMGPAKKFGPEQWGILHRRALRHDGSDDSVWMAKFTATLPAMGCKCRQHWEQLLRDHPPRWDDYFPWTVDAHNIVNARVKNPQKTLEEALAIWCTNDAFAVQSADFTSEISDL